MKKTLIKNADWIITMNSEQRRLRNSNILIEGPAIAAIGENIEQPENVDEVIDGRGMIAVPGFINTHHHLFQSLVRNLQIANEVPLYPWLKVVYDIFQEITPEVVEAGALVGLGELLKSGCTTSTDHHYAFPSNTDKNLIDVQIKAARKLGIRFHPTRGSLSTGQADGAEHVPDLLVEDVDDILADSERLIKTYHDPGRYSMCRIALAPCWSEFERIRLMEETRELARRYGVLCHSHICESKYEVKECEEKFGCRPVEVIRRLGWLGEDVWFAHSIHLNDDEIRLFGETGTGVAHCPVCNMKLNSGVCRVPDLLDAGARVGLGVDGAASNNASNMITEIRVAYLVHRLTYGDRAPSAETILEIATAGGARVLGRDDIGRLDVGMAADIVLINWNQLDFAGGRHEPISAIVMSGDSKMVDTVLVNGEVAVKQGRLVNVDEAEIAERVNEVSDRMLKNASRRIHIDY